VSLGTSTRPREDTMPYLVILIIANVLHAITRPLGFVR
jgi:hypothetical protein